MEDRSFMDPIVVNGALEELARLLGGKVTKITIPLFKMSDFTEVNRIIIEEDDKFKWRPNVPFSSCSGMSDRSPFPEQS